MTYTTLEVFMLDLNVEWDCGKDQIDSSLWKGKYSQELNDHIFHSLSENIDMIIFYLIVPRILCPLHKTYINSK